ncbi:MAG: hypothetical protein BroJett011_45320 [Chloroflexota bacterium]|nr:MAG: hypothetical protein BroJett011_45320 [Chloroflexota bacterium]
MKMSGTMGDMVFDRRGFVRLKGEHPNLYSASQGDIRQAMTVAQKCVKVCGPATRQLLRSAAEDPAHWNTYLTKNLIGSDRAFYLEAMDQYINSELDHDDWEAAASEAGLRPVNLEYATVATVSPGAQLFALASTLFSLGIYTGIGSPNGNAAAWKNQIIS